MKHRLAVESASPVNRQPALAELFTHPLGELWAGRFGFLERIELDRELRTATSIVQSLSFARRLMQINVVAPIPEDAAVARGTITDAATRHKARCARCDSR